MTDIMGAEILFHRMVALGGPGLMVAWIVTPIVIVFMWKFGTRILRIGSPALVIVIACATSVCGVSAAIGLESDFRRLIAQVVGGRPIVLHLVGQTFNILLTLAVAYLAFGGILFDLPG